MKYINLCYTAESLYSKKFQDLESQVLNSAIFVKTWTWSCKIVAKKNVRFQTCGCQVLTIMFTCGHVLEDQVMKDIILGKGQMLKFFAPKSFKTWKAKS